MKFYNLDEIDKKLIELLNDDGRMTYAEMARHTHLSRVAVRDRVKVLIQKGIIRRFTVQINASSVGYHTLAFLKISLSSGSHGPVVNKLIAFPQITHVLSTTGSTMLHVQGFFESITELNKFIREEISPLPGIQSVETHLVLENHKLIQCMV